MNILAKEKRLRKGITLISLVVTIIVLLILSAIVIMSLKSNESILIRTEGAKKDAVAENIQEYIKSAYAQILSNSDSSLDILEELENQIALENNDKDDKSKFIVKSVDKAANKIQVEHQGVLIEVDLTDFDTGQLKPSSEEDKSKLYSVVFDYRDVADKMVRKTFFIKDGQSIQDYLDSSGDLIPSSVDWEPSLELNKNISQNTVYRQKSLGYVEEHTVGFDLNGGSINGVTTIPYMKVAQGSKATSPGFPVKEHNDFITWTPSLETVIDKDMVFVAEWKTSEYTFTYNLNGGHIGGVIHNITEKGPYNTNTTTPDNPVRNGYAFAGWSPTVPTIYDANRIFIAQWIPFNFTFTFKLNGGNVGGSTSDKKIVGEYDSPAQTPGIPVRAHHTFAGWSPEVPPVFDGNRTFTAKWTVNKYTITYNLDGGIFEGSTVNPVRQVEYNTMPPNLKPTKEGYDFLGWTPDLEKSTKNQTYKAMWYIPMIVQMKKLNINDPIFIPVVLSDEGFVMVSTAGGDYERFKTDHPTTTNNVPAGQAFIVKIAGRFEEVNYDTSTNIQREQMFKIMDWGVLGANRFSFANCKNLTGPLPVPRHNSFVDVTSFYRMFYGNTSLSGNIPDYLFKDAPNVETFEQLFYECRNLSGSIPEDLFKYNPNVISFYGTFYACSGIMGRIPEDLFKYNLLVEDFSYVFRGCTYLIGSIPENLFVENLEVVTFAGTFYGCRNLSLVPENLFDNNLEVESFSYTFSECTALMGNIPVNLFSNNSKVKTFTETFNKCSGFTGNIPENLFINNPAVTRFDGTFSECTGLMGNIPENLFANNKEVLQFSGIGSMSSGGSSWSGGRGTFYRCTSLRGSIPANLFANNTKATNFSAVFEDCTGLTGSIPKDLFKYNTQASSLNGIFIDCTGLTGSIPKDFFKYNTRGRAFSVVFKGCRGLTGSIPKELFENCSSAYSFDGTFKDCTGLTGSIPATLFANCTDASSFEYTFDYCTGLTGSIPATLFSNCTRAYYFEGTFRNCIGLTGSIPASLFSKCSYVYSFSGTFSECSGLTGPIPANLFINCTRVEDFSSTFSECSGLNGSIPATLFSNCTRVESFSGTFSECSGLTGPIPVDLFSNCLAVREFTYTFYYCTGLTGNAPELWVTHKSTKETYSCFYQCYNLSNYSSIPSSWR